MVSINRRPPPPPSSMPRTQPPRSMVAQSISDLIKIRVDLDVMTAKGQDRHRKRNPSPYYDPMQHRSWHDYDFSPDGGLMHKDGNMHYDVEQARFIKEGEDEEMEKLLDIVKDMAHNAGIMDKNMQAMDKRIEELEKQLNCDDPHLQDDRPKTVAELAANVTL